MCRAHVLVIRRAKIVLYSLWYHHTNRWPSRAQVEEGLIYLFININQLDASNFLNKFTSSLYMFRAHVLIVRRAKLFYTV